MVSSEPSNLELQTTNAGGSTIRFKGRCWMRRLWKGIGTTEAPGRMLDSVSNECARYGIAAALGPIATSYADWCDIFANES